MDDEKKGDIPLVVSVQGVTLRKVSNSKDWLEKFAKACKIRRTRLMAAGLVVSDEEPEPKRRPKATASCYRSPLLNKQSQHGRLHTLKSPRTPTLTQQLAAAGILPTAVTRRQGSDMAMYPESGLDLTLILQTPKRGDRLERGQRARGAVRSWMMRQQ